MYRLEKLADLPPDIVDRYQRKQFLLKLGLFPEISRVWCVVDTDFFMWHAQDYAADFQAVTNIAEVITAVALVKTSALRRRASTLLTVSALGSAQVHRWRSPSKQLPAPPRDAGGC